MTKNKYCTFNIDLIKDLKDPNDLALFINIWVGKFVDIDKEKLHSAIGMSKTAFTKSWKKIVSLGYGHETDQGKLVVNDVPDAMLNHSNGEASLFPEITPLVNWLDINCPRVQRMKQPITAKESAKLMEDFNKEPLKVVFTAMENRGNLHTAYVSANLTVRSWIDDCHKKVIEDQPKQDKGATTKLINEL